LSPVAAVVLYFVVIFIFEMLSKYRLKFYEKQGIKTFYFPIYGVTEFYKAKRHQQDGLRRFRELVAEMKDHDLIAVNYPMTYKPIVILLDSDLTKEFYLQELNFVRRMFPFDLKLKGGFLFDYSHRGHHMRSIFSSFFSNENMSKITPSIRHIVKDYLSNLRIPEELSMLVNFKKEIDKIIVQVVNVVLFGETDIPVVNGVTVTEELVKIICSMISEVGIYNKWNIYSMDLLNILNLLPNSRKVITAKKEIERVILETYNRRKSQPKESLGCNLIDLMILHNMEAREKGQTEDYLTDEDIIGCIITLQFASADTTKNLVLNTLYFLGKNVDYQNKLYSEIIQHDLHLPSTGYFGLDNSDYFNCFIKECLRLFGPGVQSFDREVVKDFKLGKYTFKKGTIVVVPLNANCVNDKYFDNPYDFNPNRFTTENFKKLDKMAYHPFGFGRRGCFGQYLGVLIVKLIVTHLLEEYLVEFDETQLSHPYYMVSITYGVSDCYLYVQHRNPVPQQKKSSVASPSQVRAIQPHAGCD
jgi:cytochrome P450